MKAMKRCEAYSKASFSEQQAEVLKRNRFSERCAITIGFPSGASGKESTSQYRRHERLGFNSWVGKIPWGRKRQPTPVFLPGKSHGQRSLVGYTVHEVAESDTTERLTLSLPCSLILFLLLLLKIFDNIRETFYISPNKYFMSHLKSLVKRQ